MAQKDIYMEEMMIAVGSTDARIRLGEWVHLKFHLSPAGASSRAGESTKAACGNLINKDQPRLFFIAAQ